MSPHPTDPKTSEPRQSDWRRLLRLPAVWISVAAVLLLILLIWLWPSGGSLPDPEASTDPVQMVQEQRTVELFFPTAGTRLRSETRSITVRERPEADVRAIVELLLLGPDGTDLFRPLPEGIELVAVYLKDGVAYLDLHRPETVPPLAIGSNQERQAVFSLVNSVVTNVPDIGSVVLLWEGRQWSTFAGHLDTSQPLAANMQLVTR